MGNTIDLLRYALRKMKAHDLLGRNGRQYSYLLTEKGLKVATMFIPFHKRLCDRQTAFASIVPAGIS